MPCGPRRSCQNLARAGRRAHGSMRARRPRSEQRARRKLRAAAGRVCRDQRRPAKAQRSGCIGGRTPRGARANRRHRPGSCRRGGRAGAARSGRRGNPAITPMSLAGRRIVVTPSRDPAEPFARLLQRRGARAFVFPAIEIQPLPAPAALAQLADFNIAVFISPSAVRVTLPAISPWPRGVTAAAVGSGTRRELERAGVAPVIAPSVGADSEALAALPEMPDLRGKRVLIVRGEGGRALLGETLAARGARVEYAECYPRLRPVTDAAPLLASWRAGQVHAVTLSSAEG